TAGVQRVTSVSMENVSVVTVEFDWGVNVSAAIEDLRAQLAALSFLLPADAQDPLVLQLDLSQLPVVIIGVSAEGDLLHATGRALTDVRPLLEQVPGVAQVAVVGGAEREIQVLYDPDKLAEHELTPAILEQFLALQNAMVPAASSRTTASATAPASATTLPTCSKSGTWSSAKAACRCRAWRPFGLPCCMSKTWPRSSTA